MGEIELLFFGSISLALGIYLFILGDIARVLGIIFILGGGVTLAIILYPMYGEPVCDYHSSTHPSDKKEIPKTRKEKQLERLREKIERETTCPDCGNGKLKGWSRCASCRNERRRERKEERQRD